MNGQVRECKIRGQIYFMNVTKDCRFDNFRILFTQTQSTVKKRDKLGQIGALALHRKYYQCI